MIGMDKQTGKWIDGNAHLEQSLEILITTNIGERVERRNLGLNLDIVDDIYKGGEDGEIAYAVAESLDNANETRIELKEVHFLHNAPHQGKFDVEVKFQAENQLSTLTTSIKK